MTEYYLSEESRNKIKEYYRTADLWLPKFSNFRQFKCRIDNGTKKGKIIIIKDTIRTKEDLRKWLCKLVVKDIWYSSGCFLNPSKVRGKLTKNYLLFRNMPFDLDADKPYGKEELEIVKQATINLINDLRDKLGIEPIYILFTGKKGLQVVYEFKDLNSEIISQLSISGIDREITKDKYRVIRLPKSINQSGRLAVFLTEKELYKSIDYILNKSKQVYIPYDNKERVEKPAKANDSFSQSSKVGGGSESYPNCTPPSNSDSKQVLLGSLFGDAHLEKKKSRHNPTFKEQHSLKQKDYLLWKKDILSSILKGMHTYSFSVLDERYHKTYNAIRLSSPSLPILKEYHQFFYPEGHGEKRFTFEMLNKLEPLGLAVWYMDDGTFRKQNSSSDIAVNKINVDIVQQWFEKKMNIKSSIYTRKDSNSSVVHFNKENTSKLFKIISPYIHISMLYKIIKTEEEMEEIRRKKREVYQRHKQEQEFFPNRPSPTIYVTNEVKGTKRFIPILKYRYKEIRFNPNKELKLLAEKYGLREWYFIKTEDLLCCINLVSMDRKRLQKVLNSTQSPSKQEFKKFRKIFMKIASEEDKAIPYGFLLFDTNINKQFLYSRPHIDMLNYFNYEVNPLNEYIGNKKPRILLAR